MKLFKIGISFFLVDIITILMLILRIIEGKKDVIDFNLAYVFILLLTIISSSFCLIGAMEDD